MSPVPLAEHESPVQDEHELGCSVPRSEGVVEKSAIIHVQPCSNESREPTDGVKEAQAIGEVAVKISRQPSSSGVSISDQVSSPSPNRDDQIDYLYLTFDTILPEPNISLETPESAIPARPDLSRYVDPLRWPKQQKNIMLGISCVATFFTAYAAGAYSPPIELIAEELHTTREVALLGVTTFCLGFAYAPMVLAPFSEFTGRYTVFAIAGVGFTAFQAACGFVTTTSGMLFSRFFKGVASSVYSTIASGVLSDIYEKEARNTPMALFSGVVLAGTGLGPLVSSVIVGELGSKGRAWRWVFWHQIIADFILAIAVCIFFKESRGTVVLSRKAQALNKWYDELEREGFVGVWVQEAPSSESIPSTGLPEDCEKQVCLDTTPRELRRIRWKTKADEERGSLVTMISISLTRPFHFLFTEPIVFFFSLWVSFAWAILYLMFSSITLVFGRQHGFSIQQSGYVFAAMIVGSVIATFIGIFQEDLLRHPSWKADAITPGGTAGLRSRFWIFVRRKFPAESSESRLYFACFTSALLPAGLYLFGFSSRPSIHWIVPTIAIGLATMGIYSIYLATFNYFADSYRAYASSAIAAQSFCRNVLAGVFPLVTSLLWTNLGEANAGATLGSIAALFTIVPWALVFYGDSIRRKSKYAVTLGSA